MSRSRAPASSSGPAWVISIAAVVALAAAVYWIVATVRESRSTVRRSRTVSLLTYDRPFPAEGRYPADPYVGSAACSECHPGEAALFARSGHSSTLRPAGKPELARELDGTSVADPEIPGVSWSYRYRDGQLLIARNSADGVEECVADYAFGSGRHATTFVSMIRPETPAILEHRLTYFAHIDGLDLTPGHNIKPPPPGLTALGGVPPARSVRTCFGCHATEISIGESKGIDEAMMIPNVTCERCHGPGRDHIEAVKRGNPDSERTMRFSRGQWTAPELLRFCGDCHRHPSGPRPDQIRRGDPLLARFQPIGLSLSKCYRESAGKLSCVTCHDPHGRASGHRDDSLAACLKCHGESGAGPSSHGTSKEAAKRPVVCPVSPSERCIECHMPRVTLEKNVVLSDHWIRILERDHPQSTEGTQAPDAGQSNHDRP